MNTTKVGDRVRVVATNDHALRPGMTGTVAHVDLLLGGRAVTVDWDERVPNDPALIERFGDRWEVIA